MSSSLTYPAADAAPSVGKWQPIATAPKDGLQIDVWCPGASGDGWRSGYRVADAYWCAVDHAWRQNGQVVRCVWAHQPTHWMPLPKPPTDGATETPAKVRHP